MQSEQTATAIREKKPLTSRIGRMVLKFVILTALINVYGGLPSFVKVILLIIAVTTYFRPVFVGALQLSKALVIAIIKAIKKAVLNTEEYVEKVQVGLSRTARVFTTIYKMDKDCFDKKFASFSEDVEKLEPESTTAQPSFVPGVMCKPLMNTELASQLAKAWWETEADGYTGEDRLAELLSEIASSDPTKHTCVLNQHDELQLPIEKPVLTALAEILKFNGIAVDITEDEELIVSWGQTSDGKEASEY